MFKNFTVLEKFLIVFPESKSENFHLLNNPANSPWGSSTFAKQSISLKSFLLKLWLLFTGFWTCFIYEIYWGGFWCCFLLMVSDALILDTKQINSSQKNYALLCIFSCFRLQPRWKAQTYWWISYTVLSDYKCAAHFSYWCVSETNQKSSKPMISQYL